MKRAMGNDAASGRCGICRKGAVSTAQRRDWHHGYPLLKIDLRTNWQAIYGDCVDVLAQMPVMHWLFGLFSSIRIVVVYSESVADMGNSTDAEFAEHYAFSSPRNSA